MPLIDYTREEGEFQWVEGGSGPVLVLLHGLMGGLSNFEVVFDHFREKGFRVVLPSLPLYSMPVLNTNIKNVSKYLHRFLKHLQLSQVTLIGNSLGGHVALVFARKYPEMVRAMVLTGSSGLYENAMGESFPRRGDYEYIKKKTKEVFYDPEVATKELVDEVFSIVNDRNKVIRTLAMSKSAIRHNMSSELTHIALPVCLIWGRNDTVTPPAVADKFLELLPDAELNWIEQCGHAAMMERPDEFIELTADFIRRRIEPSV
ncbi:alpha/beta fold hydrolase [bacterium]|nr:alpha/beta fold hydrolase [bacterium]